MSNIDLVLASGSPRRKELLDSMGVAFSVHVTDTDESRRESEHAEDFVIRLARDKARAAAKELISGGDSNKVEDSNSNKVEDSNSNKVEDSNSNKVEDSNNFETTAILAADTIVVQSDKVFGKPRDFEHASAIWRTLSANKHQVMTAVCLMHRDKLTVKLGVTDVEFGSITPAQMQSYWDSNEPQDKAGAYAIQGLASAWVKLIHGSYSNVVGLPLREVNELLAIIDRNWL